MGELLVLGRGHIRRIVNICNLLHYQYSAHYSVIANVLRDYDAAFLNRG